MSFITICSYVMLNLFILVILQQFDEYYLPKDNVIERFKNSLEDFKEVWKIFAARYNGMKIRDAQLVDFFRKLKKPLGMARKTKTDIMKEVLKMGLRRYAVASFTQYSEEDGMIFFNELLYRCMRRAYGNVKLSKDLQAQEMKTQFRIYQITLKMQKTYA